MLKISAILIIGIIMGNIGEAQELTNPFSWRTEENRIEYIPLGGGGWYKRLDSAYDKAAEVYPEYKSFVGYMTRVLVFPETIRGRECEFEVKWAVVEGAERTYWVVLSPGITEDAKDSVLESAFGYLFGVASGRAGAMAWKMPGCLD